MRMGKFSVIRWPSARRTTRFISNSILKLRVAIVGLPTWVRAGVVWGEGVTTPVFWSHQKHGATVPRQQHDTSAEAGRKKKIKGKNRTKKTGVGISCRLGSPTRGTRRPRQSEAGEEGEEREGAVLGWERGRPGVGESRPSLKQAVFRCSKRTMHAHHYRTNDADDQTPCHRPTWMF